MIRNLGSRLHKLGKKRVKCSNCNKEAYLEPNKNKCGSCDSENIELIEEADTSYKGHYYNVFQLGLHTVGEIDERYGFPILPVGDDPCGADRLLYYLVQYRIDVLITITDIHQQPFYYIKDVVKATNVYWIHHQTIFSTPLSPFYAMFPLKYADLIIAPSVFCEQVIRNGGFDNLKMIYHGVDLKVFKPMPEQREKDRKEMKLEDKFIFLYVARNVPFQKEFPTLFHAYKTFLHNVEGAKEKTLLHNHTNPRELTGYDLELMAHQFGISENVLFTAGCNANFTLPPEKMAEIYNYGDVSLVCSNGESFSMPLIESMACGKPVIAMDFSSPPELIKNSGAGLLAKIKAMFTSRQLSDLCIPDELHYAECMGQLYQNKELREEMGKKGVEFAKSFDWDLIVKEWLRFLE